VREGEGFDLLPGERVIHVEWDPPNMFHLVLLLEDEALGIDGSDVSTDVGGGSFSDAKEVADASE